MKDKTAFKRDSARSDPPDRSELPSSSSSSSPAIRGRTKSAPSVHLETGSAASWLPVENEHPLPTRRTFTTNPKTTTTTTERIDVLTTVKNKGSVGEWAAVPLSSARGGDDRIAQRDPSWGPAVTLPTAVTNSDDDRPLMVVVDQSSVAALRPGAVRMDGIGESEIDHVMVDSTGRAVAAGEHILQTAVSAVLVPATIEGVIEDERRPRQESGLLGVPKMVGIGLAVLVVTVASVGIILWLIILQQQQDSKTVTPTVLLPSSFPSIGPSSIPSLTPIVVVRDKPELQELVRSYMIQLLQGFPPEQPMGAWDVSNVTDMSELFLINHRSNPLHENAIQRGHFELERISRHNDEPHVPVV